MSIKANNFVWINEPEELDEKTKKVLDNVQDTDTSAPVNDAREKFKDKKPKALPAYSLSKDGSLILERSQYIDDMIGAEDENTINKKK